MPSTNAFPEGRARALLRATLSVVGERGYSASTVKEIADRAGMAAGTVYLYFPSKEALGSALIHELYRRTLQGVVKARAGVDGPLAKLDRSLEAVLRTFGEDPPLSRFVLVLAPGAHPSFDQELVEVHRALASRVTDDLLEAGGLSSREATLAGWSLIGAVGEVVTAWVREEKEVSELMDAAPVLRRMLRALSRPA